MEFYKNAWIYTEDFSFKKGCFAVEDGVFREVFGRETEDARDLGGARVIPGLIDIHTHGNSGADFSDGDAAGLLRMLRYYAKNGITSCAPTSLTLPYETLAGAFATARKLADGRPEDAAAVRGINMEGPFFNEKKKGAQNAAYLRLPDYEAFRELNEGCGGLIRIADVAPELEGALDFIRKASRDCTVSIAHTDTDYEHARAGIEAGATQLTHLFNAMPGIHHRKPGPIVAAAEDERVSAELIGDGLHVDPACVRFAFRVFGPERIVLISDSLRCCGMPDGEIDMGGQKAWLKNGVARLADGTIAGSATNVYECMQRVVSFGIPKEDAVRAATWNAARQLGCLDRVGSIADGKQADFVICDEELNRLEVRIAGKKIG
ncbi:MAG: N-acetylglucosamine-6-phosphate deacetylase [Oscillospiraceae bacterium]|nr:N-acetylglucosamine-6-phosphate deacetylase [Oscillospiraceae bacterium]